MPTLAGGRGASRVAAALLVLRPAAEYSVAGCVVTVTNADTYCEFCGSRSQNATTARPKFILRTIGEISLARSFSADDFVHTKW